MFEVGRVCLKIAGRDAGKIAIVVEKLKDNNVLIDGNVRRRKCNVIHLEPSSKTIDIKKGASTADVHKAMSASKLKVEDVKKVKRSPRKEVDKKVKKKEKPKKEVKKKKGSKKDGK